MIPIIPQRVMYISLLRPLETTFQSTFLRVFLHELIIGGDPNLYHFSALMLASQNGHTEAINILLTAPGINVNHATVSIYRLMCLIFDLSVSQIHCSYIHLVHLYFEVHFIPHKSHSLSRPLTSPPSFLSTPIYCQIYNYLLLFILPPFLFPFRRRASQH